MTAATRQPIPQISLQRNRTVPRISRVRALPRGAVARRRAGFAARFAFGFAAWAA